ncbi:MAG: exo-alpha-sialidase [Bacteroidota bacterium]|nr:exo-alpha-sialidase [Bacteroidota bacterium]
MKKYFFLFCCLLIAMAGNVFAKNKFSADGITAIAKNNFIPIVKGVASNPVMKIIVAVPAGNVAQKITWLQGTITSYNEVEKIDVYRTGAEPFSSGDLVSTYLPASAAFDIPIKVTVQPGIQFIWLSVVLKKDASVNRTIELYCNKMIDDKGKTRLIKQENNRFKHLTGSAVRKGGEDGVNTYRIPGIVQTDKGTLVAVFDIRYNNSSDLPGHIDIGICRSADSGRSWQPMKVIVSMGDPTDNSGIGDPSILFDAKTNTVWVAALWSKGNHSIAGSVGGLSPDSTGQFLLVKSSDDGVTWSSPKNITSQIKIPAWKIFFQGPGSGIMMQNGTLVFPAQYWDENKMPHSTIIYSDDHGANWKGRMAGPKANTTESQVVETTAGTLMLNMRDNRGSYRSVATTDDLGKIWTEHSTSYNALPDPVCQGSIIKANVKVKGVMKEVLFFSNAATTSGRYNITIKASLDLGKTWLPVNQLLIDERDCYGYSCLTKVDENNIGILYEGLKDLYFVKVPVSEIIR